MKMNTNISDGLSLLAFSKTGKRERRMREGRKKIAIESRLQGCGHAEYCDISFLADIQFSGLKRRRAPTAHHHRPVLIEWNTIYPSTSSPFPFHCNQCNQPHPGCSPVYIQTNNNGLAVSTRPTPARRCIVARKYASLRIRGCAQIGFEFARSSNIMEKWYSSYKITLVLRIYTGNKLYRPRKL